MVMMAESFSNSPSTLIFPSGFGCFNNQICKVRCFVFLKQHIPHEINSRAVNNGSSSSTRVWLWQSELICGSVKARKFVNFRVMIHSFGDGLGFGQSLDSCNEGFKELQQQLVLKSRNSGRGVGCGSVVTSNSSMVSRGEEKLKNRNSGRNVECGGSVVSVSSSMVSRGGEKFENRDLGRDVECGGSVVSVNSSMVSRRGEKFENRDLGRDVECGGSVISLNSSMVSRGGENGVVNYSEERDEEVLSKRTLNSSMVSRRGENRVNYLEERDEDVLSKRILNLSRTNRTTSALVLFRSMKISGLKPDLHACNSLLACFLRNNMVDDMLRVFKFMKTSKGNTLSGHSCSLVLKAVAKHHGSDTAFQMFLEWVGESDTIPHLDSVVYNTMISICGKENDWVRMKKIWELMKENGVVGTTVTYRVLVCTFVRCSRYENAIDAYSELLQNELEPGFDAMQAVIGACAKEEKWSMALSVFHSMSKRGLKPNLVTCNALINLLGKAGKIKEAYNVYKHVRTLGHVPDSYTWNALLSAFYRANQYTAALQLFDGIQKDLNFQPSLYLYNTALMCCQRVGYWEKALQYLWKMEESGITVGTESYNIVMSVCESAKKPKVALEVYEHMGVTKCVPDMFTHLSLIRSCIWGDLWDEVDKILDESAPNVSLYNAAIHGMCLKRKFESAKKLYVKMRDLGLVPDGKTRALMLQYMRRGT